MKNLISEQGISMEVVGNHSTNPFVQQKLEKLDKELAKHLDSAILGNEESIEEAITLLKTKASFLKLNAPKVQDKGEEE